MSKRQPASIYEAMSDATATSIIESLRSPRLDITDSESEDGLNYEEILNRYASVTDQFAVIRCQALLRKYADMNRVKRMLNCIPKRTGTAREVLDTEVKYIENLEQVVEVYIKPLRADSNNKAQLISKDDLKKLFSELEVILAYARSLKSRIKERVDKWFPTQIIGDIFVQMIDFFKIYTQYCTNYPKAMETLERCKKNTSFVSFLQEREQASGVIIPIENFLIMPVQRIPRYALLVEELMRNTWETHPDYDNLKKALVRIQEVAEFVNEQKRYKENFARILEIYNNLVGIKTEAKQDMLILQKNIWFLREGGVLELMMKGSLTKFHIFLFNGMLLWTKQAKGNTYEFKKMTPIDPQTKVEMRTTDEGYKMIHLTTSQGLYVFKTENAEDAEAWLAKINESKNFQTPVMERKEDRLSNPASLSASPSVPRKEDMSASPSFSHGRSHSIGSAAQISPSKSSPGIARSASPAKKNRNRTATNSLVLTGSTNRLMELKEREEADTSVNTRIDEEAKFIKEWEALDDTPELDNFSVDAAELKTAFEDTSNETFTQYSNAVRAAETVNVPWEGPEYLLIGKKGEGRTSVLEALLGHHIAGSCRPLFIHLVNNPKRDKARIVIKKDLSLKSAHFFNDLEVKTEELDVEIMSRSKVFSLVPIHIHYEHKSVWNMTIIDPPGLPSFNVFEEWYQFNMMSKASIRNSQDDTTVLKDYIVEQAKVESRQLIFVEESKDAPLMSITRIAKQLDPLMTRSIFVHTKFHYKLRDMIDFNDANSYFNATNVNAAKTFWISMVKRRPRNSATEYRKKMIQTQKRDFKLLEDLQFDRKLQNQIGVVNFRTYLTNDVEKRFKEAIPAKLSQIQQLITSTYNSYEKIDRALKNINVESARLGANEFVNTFVTAFNKLMNGTQEYELKLGMSLRRENEELGGWITGDNQPIVVDGKTIKRYKERLYGNAQLLRLVSVFEQIVKTLTFDNNEIDKNLATATKSSLNQIANEIVIAKTTRHYAPLVSQLCQKITTCVKNMILAAYGVARGSISKSGSLLHDTLLLSHVKNLFEELIERITESTVAKCLNELKLAQVLSTHSFSIDGAKHSKSTEVTELIEEVFAKIGKQFASSATLQVYDMFLYSGAKEATSRLLVKVSTLSDEQLTQLGELNNTKAAKEQEQKAVLAEMKRIKEAHDALFHASQKFIAQSGDFIHSFLPDPVQALLKHTKSSSQLKA